MPTLVLGLGGLDVARGSAEALVAVRPDGTIDLAVDGTSAEAARQLAGRHGHDLECEERLAFVGRALGWSSRALTHDENVFRASLALSIASRFPPTWHDDVRRLIEAWCAFWPLALWHELPAELALPLVRTTKGRTTAPAVAVLGQSGREFGAAVYDDLDDFHSLFDRGLMQGRNRSILAGPGELPVAFDPLGVPCPFVVTSKGMKPRPPTRDDVLLLTGALELLVGILSATLETALGPDDTLRLRHDTEGPPGPDHPRERKKGRKQATGGQPARRPKKPRAP